MASTLGRYDILRELLTSKRAFHGDTPVETMIANLKQGPRELPDTVPVEVRQIGARCLEKDPASIARDFHHSPFKHSSYRADSQTLSGTIYGARYWRVNIWFASASPGNVSVFGSKVSSLRRR